MKFELEEYHRNIKEEALIADLKHIAEYLKKKTLMKYEYLEHGGKYGFNTFIRRFGSWNKALNKAGLCITRNRNVPEEELYKNIEEVWRKLGRQPRRTEMIKPLSKYSGGAYVYRFKTWSKALKKFVEFINKEKIEDEISSLKYEEVKKHRTSRDISWRLRFVIMKRDNFRCVRCGRSPATNPKIILHVDHIKAWANGGETVLENLQTLCSKCNIGKSNVL